MPCTVAISGASWDQLRHDLEDVLARHPVLFPDFNKGQRDFDKQDFGPGHRAGERFTDAWGCVWESAVDGIEGVVLGHPLDDWSRLDAYQPPDPLVQADRGPADWEAARSAVEKARQAGRIASGGLPHGYVFMRLTYLRGFENLMYDIASQDPRLQKLIDMLVAHNREIIDQWLALGVDLMDLGEDLGAQKASMISPGDFERWIAPAYKALIGPCREAGCLVALHSDGHVMELMDAFVACGIDIINPQDLCNGIDNLAREVKGRMCIRLDIDRQTIVPYGTRRDIRALIEEEVRKLGSPRGGLEMIAGIYPPTPAQNVDALCDAMEEFRTYWWDGRGA